MPSVVKLDGQSTQLVRLLEDLGHLSAEDADRLMVGVSDLLPDAPGGQVVVDAAVMRRAAAILLFGGGQPLSPSLSADWPVLFS